MAIGGFNGSDPAPTLASSRSYVADGKVHYFIGGGGLGGVAGSAAAGLGGQRPGRRQRDRERDLLVGLEQLQVGHGGRRDVLRPDPARVVELVGFGRLTDCRLPAGTLRRHRLGGTCSGSGRTSPFSSASTPIWVTVIGLVVTIGLGLGITQLQFATGQDSYLNTSDQVYKDNVIYQNLFGGEAMLTVIQVPATPSTRSSRPTGSRR